MRWAVVEHQSFERQWLVTYHKSRKGRTLDLFRSTIYGQQPFHTEKRARQAAELWEKKGNSLPTEKWDDKDLVWR